MTSSGLSPFVAELPASPPAAQPTSAPVGRREVVLAILSAIVERAHGGDTKGADRAVVHLLSGSGPGASMWSELLDLRALRHPDQLDDLLADLNRRDCPLDEWPRGLLPDALRPSHLTAGRVLLSGAVVVRPFLLAEGAVLANRPALSDDDMNRLRVLARHAWQRRRQAAGYGDLAVLSDEDGLS